MASKQEVSATDSTEGVQATNSIKVFCHSVDNHGKQSISTGIRIMRTQKESVIIPPLFCCRIAEDTVVNKT